MFEDDSAGMTFDKFTAKLRQVFPQLQNSNNRAKLLFDLSWTDHEGDNITISSDEDLTIALRQMKGLVYKINIKNIRDPSPFYD